MSRFGLFGHLDGENREQQRSLWDGIKKSIIVAAFVAVPLQTSHAAALNKQDITPPAVVDILRDRINVLRSGVTGEKIGQLRVGDTLFSRLRDFDKQLDSLQTDIYTETIDWDVLSIYPKILRAYSPLFTAYTDRAFPSDEPVDEALRYALRYEVGAFYSGVKDLEDAISKQSQRQAQRAFARISLSYDHYVKAGDLFIEYDDEQLFKSTGGAGFESNDYDELAGGTTLNYVAPSIEAAGLEDEVVLLQGGDKGQTGIVLWISKGGDSTYNKQVIIKFPAGASGHSEVRSYPYSLVAKTTPPQTLFFDDFTAAYLASAISSGIMYPIGMCIPARFRSLSLSTISRSFFVVGIFFFFV